MINLTPKKNC